HKNYAMTDLTNRYLISNQEILENLVQQFELISADNDNWTKLYFAKSDNQKWLSFFPNSEFHGGGLKILTRYPIPGTKKLIDIALNSKFDDEVIAACNVLVAMEKTEKTDFRLELITKLEQLN